jgi:hypothetical protein
MKRMLRYVTFVVLVVAALAVWKRTEIARLQAVLSLFDADRIVQNFSHMDAAFLSVPVRTARPVLALPEGATMVLPAGADAWITDRKITGLVVLRDGAIVSEGYFLGTTAQDKRISWSVSKSFLSALFGIIMAQGAIASLDDPVTQYASSLLGSAYDGVSVRDVLTMSSGVRFDESYLDFFSDINQMGRILAIGGSMDGFATGLTARDRPAGQAWQYVSIDTHVLGMVIRGATGRGIAELMSEELIQPLGLEADAAYVTGGYSEPFVLGGLNMTTRDYARLGLLYLQQGRIADRQIVPADWVEVSTLRQAKTPPGAVGYGYQWWLPVDAKAGEFMARGVYGQYIYVNRAQGTVIAVNAADTGFTQAGVDAANVAMFRKIAAWP